MNRLKFIVTALLISGLQMACSELEVENNNQQSLTEKVEALQVRIEEKDQFTQEEQRSLAQLQTVVDSKIKKNNLAMNEAHNRTFNYDDLSREYIEFNAIDQAPVFEACQKMTEEEARSCVQKTINATVMENFGQQLQQKDKLWGTQRVEVSFVIDNNGDIERIRARHPNPEMVAEAERVINLLPKMIPGTHNGKTTASLYALPIVMNFD